MCFSAEASFAAASALTLVGAIALRRARSRAHLPLAAIPLLFAAQQICEGLVWLVLEGTTFAKSDTVLGRVFLLFALAIWPPYVPLALRPLEKSGARRGTLTVLAIAGGVLGAYLMGCATLRSSDVCIAFGNLYYWVQIDTPMKPGVRSAYVAIVVGALLVSSARGTRLLAVVVLASAAAVGSLYPAGFISVWCFFAAVLSGTAAAVVGLSQSRLQCLEREQGEVEREEAPVADRRQVLARDLGTGRVLHLHVPQLGRHRDARAEDERCLEEADGDEGSR